jgi:hypothetical protein
METASEKQHAHELIERLPPSQVPAVIHFLEFMLLDPVTRALAIAPPDDEPITEEDRRCVREGEAWFRQHGERGIPMEDVLAEFDLTMDDFPHSAGEPR